MSLSSQVVMSMCAGLVFYALLQWRLFHYFNVFTCVCCYFARMAHFPAHRLSPVSNPHKCHRRA